MALLAIGFRNQDAKLIVGIKPGALVNSWRYSFFNYSRFKECELVMQRNLEKHIKLFENITEENISSMLACLGAKTKKYKKNSIIIFEEDKVDRVGIVLEGAVLINKDDFAGNRSVVNRVGQYDLFGEVFVCAGLQKSPVNVIAAENCEIMWIQFHRIVNSCSTACEFHLKLIENMIKLLAIKNLQMNQKMEIVSKRNLREKLITYLYLQAENSKTPDFLIPLTRAELADYLFVNRSALSRELSKMRDEGIIKYKKNHFYINRN
jgi:CRP/FNR family transcriptional regulator, dissimilatory nitrate respiration regulator